MIENPYDSVTSQLYFDIKMKEFLFVILQQHVRLSGSGFRFTDYELSRLETARRLLLEDLSKKSYTISQLAKAAGINSFKLKIGCQIEQGR